MRKVKTVKKNRRDQQASVTIRSQGPGMGIRLQEISQQDLALIRDFVEQVLAKK